MLDVAPGTVFVSAVFARSHSLNADGSVSLAEIGVPTAYQAPGEQAARLTCALYCWWLMMLPPPGKHVVAVRIVVEGEVDSVQVLREFESVEPVVSDWATANLKFDGLPLGEHVISIEVDGKVRSMQTLRCVAGFPPAPQAWPSTPPL